jgi:hypothetical protein
VELHDGFGSGVANNETAFMVLEGPLIIVAVATMAVFHPGPAFCGKWAAATWSFRERGIAEAIEKEQSTQQNSGLE